jgi:hypothetical protein
MRQQVYKLPSVNIPSDGHALRSIPTDFHGDDSITLIKALQGDEQDKRIEPRV